uniref:Glutaredoxin domain-containing protein n=1 Tax=Fibrocapsa japonica TaxID=94617 RepID=A0A7S2UZM7_9STRA
MDFLQREISSNPCVIFSSTTCPSCDAAKAAITETGAKMVVHELDGFGEDFKNAVTQLSGMRTVPKVFIGGNCIGGAQETQGKAQTGELRALLQNAGAF